LRLWGAELEEFHRLADGFYKNIVLIACDMPHRETSKVVLVDEFALGGWRRVRCCGHPFLKLPTETLRVVVRDVDSSLAVVHEGLRRSGQP